MRPARVIKPIPYATRGGRQSLIPVGPCLLECDAQGGVAIVWGARGQRSAALPSAVLESAREQGRLQLLEP